MTSNLHLPHNMKHLNVRTKKQPLPDAAASAACCWCKRKTLDTTRSNVNPTTWVTRAACWWLSLDYEAWQTHGNTNVASKQEVGMKLLESPVESPIRSAPAKGRAPEIAWPLSAESAEESPADFMDMTQVESWDFDIFEMAETTPFPLVALTLGILDREGLIESLGLQKWKMRNFLYEIEARYRNNPYHNNLHGADVVQTSYAMYKNLKDHIHLTELELFCLLLASAVHDVEHPGVNNDFMVKSCSPEAIRFNDRSVNENLHISTAKCIMANDEFNALDGLSPADTKRAKSLMVDLVLSTDLAYHFDLMVVGKGALSEYETSSYRDLNNLVMQLILHISDISNPARPFKIACRWAEYIIQEFIDQGKREQSLGLGVSPPCDTKNLKLPLVQEKFIKLFCVPSLDLCGLFLKPEFLSILQEHLDITLKTWQKLGKHLHV